MKVQLERIISSGVTLPNLTHYLKWVIAKDAKRLAKLLTIIS